MDIVGKKFNKWTVLEKSTKNKRYYLCQCECGTTKEVRIDKLIRGESKSCGCIRNHKKTNTRIYHIWENMKSRCYNQNNPRYKHYAGRGITICDEWKNDFMSFYKWAMANGYSDNLSIDRINNNGNYEPSNCRWTDKVTQANNTTRNHYLIYKNRKLTMTQWSRKAINEARKIIDAKYSDDDTEDSSLEAARRRMAEKYGDDID